MNLESFVEIKNFDGLGYQPVIDYESWRVAYLRYHPELLPENLDTMQRHNETDEVFVLLEGHCILFVGDGREEIVSIEAIDMLPFQIYNVKRACWHTHTLSEDARVLIVENRDTTENNSPKIDLTSAQCQLLQDQTRQLWKDH